MQPQKFQKKLHCSGLKMRKETPSAQGKFEMSTFPFSCVCSSLHSTRSSLQEILRGDSKDSGDCGDFLSSSSELISKKVALNPLTFVTLCLLVFDWTQTQLQEVHSSAG